MNIIAIDFDDVISDAPMRWLQIIALMEQLNFHVIVVTYRQCTAWPEDLDFLREKGYKVIMTGQKAKRPFVKALGYDVKIWIDDQPESILFDYNVFKGQHTFSESHDFPLRIEEKSVN